MTSNYGRFEWNHCAICGLALVEADDGQSLRPHCKPCNRFFYSNPVPAACCFLTNEAGELLLVQRSIEPRKGLWTLPGGFVEVGPAAFASLGVEGELADQKYLRANVQGG